ncbi:MAG TPA: Holliday junction resolvase RuvX [Jatrophihabitantaceae bacterium]|nr:Holliday junction resolvase RuvX [Jatrophihabitantaceae bacterium]
MDDDAGPSAGVWFGVDVGTVRVGVARSDPRGVLASPVVTLARDVKGGADLAELAEMIMQDGAVGVVLGLPRTLAGRESASAEMARAYGSALAVRIAPIPIELLDERLTTVSAERRLAALGVRGKARRAVVDQAAAVVLLQHWLDSRAARAR